MNDELIRLSKLLSQRKICSRREADAYISKGLVIVNGSVIDTLGTKVPPNAIISLASEAKQQQKNKVTIALNKPLGYVSTQPEKNYRAAIELITPENQDTRYKRGVLKPQHLRKLAVVGRLDIDSKGLLILTQDGTLAKKIIGEKSIVEKEYIVRVKGNLSEKGLKLLKHGLAVDGKILKPARVDWINEDQLRFVLIEGRKRQIRRMCELVGIEVTALKRVRINNVRLEKLQEGKWRFLSKNEY